MGIIRRQGIQSAIIIYAGFALGAFNLLLLFPSVLTYEQIGLLLLFVSLAKIIFGFSGLGIVAVINKFFPYYDAYLEKKENDLLFISITVPMLGFAGASAFVFFFKDYFIQKSIQNSALLADYYYLILPFTFFFMLFSIFETYAATRLKTVVPAFIREIGLRLISAGLVTAFHYELISFSVLVLNYTFLYAPLTVLLVVYLIWLKRIYIVTKISKVTKRLGSKMFTYGAYVYGGVLIVALAENADTLIIGSLAGLGSVAVYQMGHFITTMIQVPYRSISAISSPVIAQAWKDKDLKLIENLYQKSSLNLLLAAFLLFGLIWVNLDFLFFVRGEEAFKEVKWVIFILGLTRILDLGFGLNSEILNNSKYWRFNFFSYIILVLLFLPANYFLVKQFGITGSAVANLLSYMGFNITRYVFLWQRCGLQPFTATTIKALLLFVFSLIIHEILAIQSAPFVNLTLNTLLFLITFAVPAWFLNLSPDVKQFAKQVYEKLSIKRS